MPTYGIAGNTQNTDTDVVQICLLKTVTWLAEICVTSVVNKSEADAEELELLGQASRTHCSPTLPSQVKCTLVSVWLLSATGSVYQQGPLKPNINEFS